MAKKKLVIQMEEELHLRFKSACVNCGEPMKQAITGFVKKYVDNYERSERRMSMIKHHCGSCDAIEEVDGEEEETFVKCHECGAYVCSDCQDNALSAGCDPETCARCVDRESGEAVCAESGVKLEGENYHKCSSCGDKIYSPHPDHPDEYNPYICKRCLSSQH